MDKQIKVRRLAIWSLITYTYIAWRNGRVNRVWGFKLIARRNEVDVVRQIEDD